MIDPYRMVFVSGIASLILLSGFLFYKFVYPKKKINFFILLIFISILPLLSLLRPGDYESGDFNIHIYRIFSFYNSLKEGIWMPSWAAELNGTYGNPLFIFNYSLPYYFVSFLHFLNFSFITSMKIYLGLNLFLSGIFMYIWIKNLTRNQLSAFTASLFYIFNPYHLIDVHFRAALGETTMFTVAPLVFYFITKYFQKKKFVFLILTSLFIGILFLAHPLLAGIFLLIAFLFIIQQYYANKKIISFIPVIVAILFGSSMSLYTVIPFFVYAPYMYPNPSQTLLFPPFLELFYAPWRYGFLFQGPKGQLALFIGYAQIFVVGFSIFLLLTKKTIKKYFWSYSFWIIILLFIVLSLNSMSKIIWNHFQILWMLIPTGRLLLPLAFCSSVIAGYLALCFTNTKKKKLFIYIVIIFAVWSTILNWGHRRVIPSINDNYLEKGVPASTAMDEGLTAYFLNNKWADPKHFWFSEVPKTHIEILKGEGNIKQLNRSSFEHTYLIDAKTPLTIQENTLYFPGWTLQSNNKNIALYPGKKGIITAKLPQGIQYLQLTYHDQSLYHLSKLLSVSVFSLLIGGLVINLIFTNFFKLKR